MRKNLASSYVCRSVAPCLVDKKRRNWCKLCRYNKCIMSGMIMELVQEERPRGEITPTLSSSLFISTMQKRTRMTSWRAAA